MTKVIYTCENLKNIKDFVKYANKKKWLWINGNPITEKSLKVELKGHPYLDIYINDLEIGRIQISLNRDHSIWDKYLVKKIPVTNWKELNKQNYE